MPSNKEYMRTYMLERYHRRRAEAIIQLGGCCKKCGDKEDLDIDHIDPKTKSFTLSQCGSASEERWQNELKKCQLLCKNCHIKKTLKDKGQLSARENHGTLSSYKYCRCDLCRAANSEYLRQYRIKKKEIKNLRTS